MKSEHALTEPFFVELRRRLVRTLVIFALLVGTGGWLMDGGKTDAVSLAAFAVILLVALPLIARYNIRRQVASFRTLRIVTDETALRRLQEGFPLLEIPWSEITSVEEFGTRGLRVRGGTPPRELFLLRTLDGFDDLRARLAGVRPIDTKPAPSNSWLIPATMLGVIVAMVGFYRSTSAALVCTLGLLLIALLIWSFVATLGSPQVDQRLKRSIWIIWLVVLSLALRIYQVVN